MRHALGAAVQQTCLPFSRLPDTEHADSNLYNRDSYLYAFLLQDELFKLLVGKLRWVKSTLLGLERMILEVRTRVRPQQSLQMVIPGNKDLFPEHPQLILSSRSWEDATEFEKRLRLFVNFVLRRAFVKIYDKVQVCGWDTFRNHLNASFVEDYDNELLRKAGAGSRLDRGILQKVLDAVRESERFV